MLHQSRFVPMQNVYWMWISSRGQELLQHALQLTSMTLDTNGMLKRVWTTEDNADCNQRYREYAIDVYDSLIDLQRYLQNLSNQIYIDHREINYLKESMNKILFALDELHSWLQNFDDNRTCYEYSIMKTVKVMLVDIQINVTLILMNLHNSTIQNIALSILN